MSNTISSVDQRKFNISTVVSHAGYRHESYVNGANHSLVITGFNADTMLNITIEENNLRGGAIENKDQIILKARFGLGIQDYHFVRMGTYISKPFSIRLPSGQFVIMFSTSSKPNAESDSAGFLLSLSGEPSFDFNSLLMFNTL